MLEIQLFRADGQHDGTFSESDNAITLDIAEAVAEVFAQGGHAEVWLDNTRMFDNPADTLDAFFDQVATAKCA